LRGFPQSAFSAADEAGKYNGLNPVTKVKRRKVPERARRGRNGGVAGPDLRDAQVVQARRRVPEDREGTRPTARWSTAATAVVSGAGKSLGEGGERRTVMLSW
jgi:hypothetical protein